MNDFKGHCLCGAVKFVARPPSLFCAHCHCRFCRVAHGAAFVTWLGLPEQQFEIEEGEADITWFASSKQSRRGFCSRCGTTILYTSTLSPGEVHVALACVQGPIDRRPQAHVFTDHKVDWCAIDDGLPQLESGSEVLAKYRDVEV